MKTEIYITVRLTDGSILEYHRTFDGVLPDEGSTHYSAGPNDSLDELFGLVLVQRRRWLDLKTMRIYVYYDAVGGPFDAQDVPFDPNDWNFEKVR